MKNRLSFIFLFTIVLVNAQQNKTTYLDKPGKGIIENKEVFYKTADDSKEKNTTSQIINVAGIDLITAGENFSLLHKNQTGYNYFLYENFISKENKKNRAYTEIKGFGKNNYSSDKIKESGKDRILDSSEIKTQRIEDLKKDLGNTIFTYYDEKEEILYKYSFPSSHIVVEQAFTFSKDGSGGFGYHEVKNDDNEQKWRLYNANSYNYFIFNLNEEQPVIVFDDHKSIVPLKNGVLLNGKEGKTEKNNFKAISWIEANTHYSIIEENGKKQLYTVFGEQVFPGNYDDILMNNYFFVTRSGKNYEVYDSFFRKIAISNVKRIYLKGSYMNVLHDNKAENLNALLQEAQPKKYSYITCSQDPNTYYRFSPAYDKSSKRNVVARIGTSWNSSEIESYALKDLPRKAKLNYIYNDVKIGRKDILNYFKSDPYDIEDFFITAEYRGKKGLYSFNRENRDFVLKATIESKDKEFQKEYDEIRSEASLMRLIDIDNNDDKDDDSFRYYDFNYEYDALTLLPMEYDDIVFRDEIIIFSKAKKFGVYKLNKEPKYKKIGIRKDNFLEITNEKDQQGWLDLATNTEYYN